jgi:retron-type reverse transcriptase
MSFLNENNLLSRFQFGFRSDLSTEYAETVLLDDIRRNVDKGNLVGAVFVDLRKAFDTLSHATLLDKLPQYGIQGTELEWFKDYLFCRKQVVAYNGFLSADHNVSTGVPQGSILGPLLFLVYFNDVIEAIEHSSIVKYADTVLYVARKDIQSIQAKLSKDMDSLADWLRENELIINLKRGKQNLFYLELRKGLQNIVNLLKYRYHVHHPLLSQQQRYTNTWEY